MAIFKSVSVKQLVSNSVCVLNRRLIMTTPWNFNEAQETLQKNPYYEKYSAKIKELQKNRPEEFKSKLKAAKESQNKTEQKLTPPRLDEPRPEKARGFIRKKLDDVMNVKMLLGKCETEIEHIWKEYYKGKDDVIYATMDKDTFRKFSDNCKACPTFAVPLPRDDGFEFFVSQFLDNQIHLAPLAMYQKFKSECPETLCLSYFVELPQNIVLMLGEYDNQGINGAEAQCLTNTLQLYYNNEKLYQLVKKFNESPDKFNYQDVINEMSYLSINK